MQIDTSEIAEAFEAVFDSLTTEQLVQLCREPLLEIRESLG